MPTRTADAAWSGDLKSGSGTMKLPSGAFEGAYSFASRFEEGTGTNPEELLAAAHAGCFSMAFANVLAQAGHPPEQVHTTAKVRLGRDDKGSAIDRIDLVTRATVPGIDEAAFQEHAEAAKTNCPVSKLFKGAEIHVTATLEG